MNLRRRALKIRCVIYDCDGVLFDSFEANRRLYNDLCAAMGRPSVTAEEMKYLHSHTVFESIHYLFPMSGEAEGRALELQKKIDVKNYIPYLILEPYVLETLDALKRKGVYRAINTNRTTSMPHIVERFHLGPHVELVVTALDVKNPKPHPESVEKILHAFDLGKDQAVFVGDSEVDRETAHASGVPFVAYKNREIADHLFIDDHREVLRLLSNAK